MGEDTTFPFADDAGEAASGAQIEDVERSVGLAIPTAYRSLLQLVNGGSLEPNVIRPVEGDGDYSLRSLMGAGRPEEHLDLARFVRTYEGRVPPNMLPVGDDELGNVFLIETEGEQVGAIWFWDHEMEADEGEAPTFSNLTLVAGSLSELADRIEATPAGDFDHPPPPSFSETASESLSGAVMSIDIDLQMLRDGKRSAPNTKAWIEARTATVRELLGRRATRSLRRALEELSGAGTTQDIEQAAFDVSRELVLLSPAWIDKELMGYALLRSELPELRERFNVN